MDFPRFTQYRLMWPIALGLVAAGLARAASPPAETSPMVTRPAFPSVFLWEGDAPLAKGKQAEDRPHLDVLAAPRDHATGTAMIVCPGGGYLERAMDWEGLQVARWLNTQGIDAFVLSYRIGPSGYAPPVAWLDGGRAVRYVRAHAAEYGVNPRRIGVIGFSAGSQIALKLSADFTPGDPQAVDPVERVSSRPDFVAGIYGIPVRQQGAAAQSVPANTPPTFIVLTLADPKIDPQFSLREIEALRAAGVEAELHVFGGDGGHGRGMHVGDPYTGVWPTLLINWLRRNVLLTDGERVPIEGMMTIDGVPMFAGWVTLTPLDNPNLPAASIFWNDKHRHGGKPGRYAIEQKYGPVPGRYRVEVIHVAKDFILVPTVEGAEHFTSLAPGSGPIILEVKPGLNVFDLAIRTK